MPTRKRGYIKTDMKNERYIKARQIALAKYGLHPRITVALDAGVKLAGDGAWVAASVYLSSADIGMEP